MHGDLDVRWIHGRPRGASDTDPPIQVHPYDRHTYVLRQSKALTAEAPFLYLLFGSERAVLFDTGASKKTVDNPLRETVDGIVEAWLAEQPTLVCRIGQAKRGMPVGYPVVARFSEFVERQQQLVRVGRSPSKRVQATRD